MLMRYFVTSIFLCVITSFLSAQSTREIVSKMDEMQTFDTLAIEGTMITIDRFGEKKSTYKAWSRGRKDFLIEFTNVEERGQKVLRLEDELYLFYPEAEDIIPMHGSALKQSLFGDVSYEDITEGGSTLDKYDVSITGSEILNDIDCWRIEMNAISKNVPYPKQIVIVGKTNLIIYKAEYYARSGRLLKIMTVISHKIFDDGRVMITEMELADQLRRGSSTRMIIDNIDINPSLNDSLFSLQSLY